MSKAYLPIVVGAKREGQVNPQVPSHQRLEALSRKVLLQAVATGKGASEAKNIAKVATKGAAHSNSIRGRTGSGGAGPPWPSGLRGQALFDGVHETVLWGGDIEAVPGWSMQVVQNDKVGGAQRGAVEDVKVVLNANDGDVDFCA